MSRFILLLLLIRSSSVFGWGSHRVWIPRKSTSLDASTPSAFRGNKGKLLVLGGSGFVGQTVCRRAIVEGFSVTSLSRRGMPNSSSQTTSSAADKIDYRTGDARQKVAIQNILQERGYVGIIHCLGLLFDTESGLGNYNTLVSGSGSLPDPNATYDTITRLTAFNAIECAEEYAKSRNQSDFPFAFVSAAEAGWPEMPGGSFIENNLAPDFLRRYLIAKRAVEERLLSSSVLRPIIVRPSLVYSLDRPASFPSVGAFFVGNRLGLPFVDRPVTVQALASSLVRAVDKDSVRGVLRYPQMDELSA